MWVWQYTSVIPIAGRWKARKSRIWVLFLRARKGTRSETRGMIRDNDEPLTPREAPGHHRAQSKWKMYVNTSSEQELQCRIQTYIILGDVEESQTTTETDEDILRNTYITKQNTLTFFPREIVSFQLPVQWQLAETKNLSCVEIRNFV